jgi:hypothetical protein
MWDNIKWVVKKYDERAWTVIPQFRTVAICSACNNNYRSSGQWQYAVPVTITTAVQDSDSMQCL